MHSINWIRLWSTTSETISPFTRLRVLTRQSEREKDQCNAHAKRKCRAEILQKYSVISWSKMREIGDLIRERYCKSKCIHKYKYFECHIQSHFHVFFFSHLATFYLFIRFTNNHRNNTTIHVYAIYCGIALKLMSASFLFSIYNKDSFSFLRLSFLCHGSRSSRYLFLWYMVFYVFRIYSITRSQ